MDVEFREPIVTVNSRAMVEVIVPTTTSTSAWRTAFTDALPTRKQYYRRIQPFEDGIHFSARNEEELGHCLDVIERTAQRANGRIEREEAKAVRYEMRIGRWLHERMTREAP